MRKLYLLLSVVILSVSLAGCAAKENPAENSSPQQEASGLPAEIEEVEVDEPKEEEAPEPEKAPEPEEVAGDPEEVMIAESDYIAKVKMIKKGQGSYELKVLDNIKGSLSARQLPNVDQLLENRVYLVFLKDEGGNTVFTDEAEGLILLEGDNHEIFEKINR